MSNNTKKDAARGALVDGLAELLSDAILAGVKEEEIRADVDACLDLQEFGVCAVCGGESWTHDVTAHRWGVAFRDEFSGEGGDMGVKLANEKDAKTFVKVSYLDTQSDFPYVATDLKWDGRKATYRYMVRMGPGSPSHWFNAEYVIYPI